MSEPPPTYSERHLDPNEAAAYRIKFQQSLTRRISTRRETRLVRTALNQALAWLLAHEATAADDATLLDYPCGAGRFAPLAAAAVGAYIAGDHSPHMLELTAQALDQAGLAAKLIDRTEGDARHMNLADNAVDVALCMRLLHHFPLAEDRIQILTHLRRCTRGPLVTSFLDADSYKQRSHVRRLAAKSRTTRRVLVTRETFAQEAAAAGWQLLCTWKLSSLFSGQRIALCIPLQKP